MSPAKRAKGSKRTRRVKKIIPPAVDDLGQSTPQGLSDEHYVKILNALNERPEVLPALLEPLHPADVANLLERLPRDRRAGMVRFVPEEKIGNVISELEPGVKDHVLHLLRLEVVKDAIEELPSDDAAAAARAVAETVTAAAPAQFAEELLTDYQQKRLLHYDPNTAGGMMQLEVVTASRTQTVDETLRQIRENPDDLPVQPGTIFVVTGSRKLLGTVSISRLVQVPLESTLGEVMRPDPLSIKPNQSRHEVVEMFEKYDMHNLAVVNRKGQLLGRIAIDDVLDVVMAEAAETQAKAVGLDADEDLFAPAGETTRHRLPWLFINLVTAIMAAGVIAFFEDSIAKLTTLAVLMPIITSMGGNATTQTQTVIIRGLALGQITPQNAGKLLLKETIVGSYKGTVMALVMALGCWLLYDNAMLAMVIALATLANHLIAAFGGWVTPLVLRHYKFDPAIATGVITTTFTDVGGFFVFLGLATWLLL